MRVISSGRLVVVCPKIHRQSRINLQAAESSQEHFCRKVLAVERKAERGTRYHCHRIMKLGMSVIAARDLVCVSAEVDEQAALINQDAALGLCPDNSRKPCVTFDPFDTG